jgi:hypothetical protein
MGGPSASASPSSSLFRTHTTKQKYPHRESRDADGCRPLYYHLVPNLGEVPFSPKQVPRFGAISIIYIVSLGEPRLRGWRGCGPCLPASRDKAGRLCRVGPAYGAISPLSTSSSTGAG